MLAWRGSGFADGTCGMPLPHGEGTDMGGTDGFQAAVTGEPGQPPELSAELEVELARCRRPLRDFGPAPADHPGFARSDLEAARVSIPAGRLPVIASLHLVMNLLIRTPGLGQSEKLAWEYAFTFRVLGCKRPTWPLAPAFSSVYA
jgi:hypothetical protein